MLNINTINQQILEETLLSHTARMRLENWFNKQNTLIKNDIVNSQKNEYFKLKKKYQSNTIGLSSYYLAIAKVKKIEEQTKSKNKSQSMSQLLKTTEYLIKKNKKILVNPKEELFLDKIGTVRKLIENNTSLRDIQAFFKRNYGKDISHTSIDKYVKKYITKDNQNEFSEY